MDSKETNCIINVAIGGWYPKGQDRLVDSLIYNRFKGTILKWSDWPNDNFDTSNNYHVKPSAFDEAIKAGYTKILWLDASVWAAKNPEHIFEIIHEQGYYLWKNGHNCAQECSDKCLDYFGLTRDQAELMPCVSSGVLGINLEHPMGQLLWEGWRKSAVDGVFNGSRLHDNQSSDSRFLHHRQDQSAASVVANMLGLKIFDMNEHCAYYDYEDKNVIFYIRGL